MRITEENVVQLLREHEAQALSFIIAEYTRPIFGLVATILRGIGTPQDIEECVSDVFVALWNRIDQYDEARGTFRTWLHIIAKYEALDLRRKLLRKSDDALAHEPSPFDPVSHAILTREWQEEFVASIEHLDSKVREVVIRRFLLQMSIQDIAAELGLTRTQVDNRLSRGRKALRQQFEITGEGGGSLGDAR